MEGMPQYTDTCSYCFSTVEDTSISFCCTVPVCSFHMVIHEGHSPIYSVLKIDGHIIVDSLFYDDEEKFKIKQFIEHKLFFGNEDTFKVECPHTNMCSDLVFRKNGVDVCYYDQCGFRNNVFLCLSCGYVGCGRKQFGRNGNGHALEHFYATKHPRTVCVESLGIDGSNSTYCYLCNENVVNKNVVEELKCIGVNLMDLNLPKIGESSLNENSESDNNLDLNMDSNAVDKFDLNMNTEVDNKLDNEFDNNENSGNSEVDKNKKFDNNEDIEDSEVDKNNKLDDKFDNNEVDKNNKLDNNENSGNSEVDKNKKFNNNENIEVYKNNKLDNKFDNSENIEVDKNNDCYNNSNILASQDNISRNSSNVNIDGCCDNLDHSVAQNCISKNKNNDKVTNFKNIDFVGIINEGYSCYISTSLHLLSLSMNKNMFTHFYTCNISPLECFFCQFIRVIEAISNKNKKIIDLTRFLNITEKEIPYFKRGYQNDPSEFLMILLQNLKIYPESQIDNTFELDLIKISICSICGSKSHTEISYNNIILSFTQSLQESLDKFFTDEGVSISDIYSDNENQNINDLFSDRNNSSTCSCKSTKKIYLKLNKIPSFLILTANRCKVIENQVVKIKENTKFVSEDTLILVNKFKYKKRAVIMHKGENTCTGHYFIKIGDVYIDDTKITTSKVDGEEYVYLYEYEKNKYSS